MSARPEQLAAKSFSTWLNTYLVQNDLIGVRVSKASGFHPNIISNWRTGRCLPNGYSMVKLATTLAYLTGEKRSAILESMAQALLWTET
jgi:hypothetical protein